MKYMEIIIKILLTAMVGYVVTFLTLFLIKLITLL